MSRFLCLLIVIALMASVVVGARAAGGCAPVLDESGQAVRAAASKDQGVCRR